mgnify:CR=1 FL=1|jgi:hypothetical protein
MALTKAHNRMITEYHVDVADYGAVGDGVTDDTVAIQAAIDSFGDDSQIRGGTIILTGNYAISNTLLFKNKSIDFSGSGFGAVTGDAQTYIVWIGTTNDPMIRLQSCRATKIRNIRFIGNVTASKRPIAAINLFVENPGDISQNSFNIIENVWIGKYDGNDATPLQTGDYHFTNGLLWDGSNTGNNYDSISNVRISFCNKGVNLATNQFGQNLFNGLWCNFCEYGFYTSAPADGINWFFDNNSIADIYVDSDSRLQVYEFASEASASFADIKNGKLTVYGGGFAASDSRFGGVVVDGSGGNPSVLCLNDFNLTDNYTLGTGIPMFNFNSANNNSVKSFTGRRNRGITEAMINIATTSGNPNQLNTIDLEVLGLYNGLAGPDRIHFKNTLGPSASSEDIDSDRQDMPVNVRLHSGLSAKPSLLAAGTTPSVLDKYITYSNLAAPASISNFTNGVTGQIIIVYAAGVGATTLTNGASLKLAGAVDFVMSANDTCTLMQISANLWLELARSNN